MKKIIWIIVAGIAFIIMIVMMKNCSGNKSTKIAVEKAGKRNVTESVSANGKIQPEVEVKITVNVARSADEAAAQARGENLSGPVSDRAEIRAAAEALFDEEAAIPEELATPAS